MMHLIFVEKVQLSFWDCGKLSTAQCPESQNLDIFINLKSFKILSSSPKRNISSLGP